MGKIKGDNLLRKQDRPRTEPKPPSMSRLKRSNRKAVPRTGTFRQDLPDQVLFRFKKKHRPTETIVHKHYSDERTDVTSTRTINFVTCKADDSVRIAQYKLMAEQKLGKIETQRRKTIWHRVDKQDNQYKLNKPYYKGNTGKR